MTTDAAFRDARAHAWQRLCEKTAALGVAFSEFDQARTEYAHQAPDESRNEIDDLREAVRDGLTVFADTQWAATYRHLWNSDGGTRCDELRAVLTELARWSEVAIRNGELHARVASALALGPEEES